MLETAYARVDDVAAGFRELDEDEQLRAAHLLFEAAVLIDSAAPDASEEVKCVVSCRMVRRALGDGDKSAVVLPIGSNQGSMAAGGYSQSWTMNGGAVGELYLGKVEKQLLGVGNRIGAHSPLEGCT